MELQNYLQKFSSICWYPSAGFDYREMLYLTKSYANRINWDEDQFPDCFVLTDYIAFSCNPLFKTTLCHDVILFQDEETKIVAKNGTELSKLNVSYNQDFVVFRRDENYGRVIAADIEIQSTVLGNMKTKAIFAVAENTSFAIEFLIRNNIHIDYVLRVRYGHMLGGGNSNGMFLKRILNDLNARYFLSDANYSSDKDCVAFDVYGELLKSRNDAELEDITYIPSSLWSRSGDVHVYKIVNEKIVCNICGKKFDDADMLFGIKQKELFAGFASSHHDGERFEFNICSDCYDVVLDKVLELCTVNPNVDEDYMEHCIDIRAHIHKIWGPGKAVCGKRIAKVKNIPDADYGSIICFLIHVEPFTSIEYITSDGLYVGLLGSRNLSPEDINTFIEKCTLFNSNERFIRKEIEDGYVLYYLMKLNPWFESIEKKYIKAKDAPIEQLNLYSPSTCIQEFSLGLEHNFRIEEQ